MKISRATLERVINEELIRYLERNLTEAAPGIGSPLDDLPPEGEDPTGSPLDSMGGPPMPADGEVQDSDVDPADADIEAELAGEEPEVPGSVAADMQGKTIEDISVEEESDTIPGAKELVVSFQGEEDKLRVIMTPTGNFKFFWKGLHSDIGQTEDVPPEEIEAEEEEELGFDDELDNLDVDATPVATDSDIDDPKNPEL